MKFSIFEIIMLLCFGVSWPIAIIKTLRSKTVKGVTPFFYWLVLTGYISGAIHKAVYCMDAVIILYLINCVTVGTQTFLYYYFSRKTELNADCA